MNKNVKNRFHKRSSTNKDNDKNIIFKRNTYNLKKKYKKM